jgi:hypothetical protein
VAVAEAEGKEAEMTEADDATNDVAAEAGVVEAADTDIARWLFPRRLLIQSRPT